jgi:hypothetical protein
MARLADSLTVLPRPGAVRKAEASAERVAAYRAHPFLDPLFPSRQRAAARFWVMAHRNLIRDPASFSRAVSSEPASSRQPDASSPVSYFEDADKYIVDLLRTAPELNQGLELLPETRGANELDALLRLVLRGTHPRPRYEAQRKLYLAKLLFDIDHCRSVRDGPKHRAIFESLLQDELWSELESDQEIEVCCELDSEEFAERLKIVSASTRAECWRFRVRRLKARNARPIEVYHFRSRFKRETDPVAKASDGALSLREEPRWPTLGRRSGSILSKMIRRGVGDPHMIQDLVGAMFIVGTRRQVYALERRLVDALGGPLRWRDRVDTISCQADRERLSVHSSPGFEVLKQIVDILVEDPAGAAPYLFPVEVQIYPLEAYLRTLHSSHYANHAAYKRRQLLHDLLPVLFPAEIYGEHASTRLSRCEG